MTGQRYGHGRLEHMITGADFAAAGTDPQLQSCRQLSAFFRDTKSVRVCEEREVEEFWTSLGAEMLCLLSVTTEVSPLRLWKLH